MADALRAPGMHDDVPEEAYHADRVSLSVSGAKTILKAPALFRWQQDHPVHKDVFDFGTAAHKLVLGVGADLVVHDYDVEKVKSPKSTKAWKEQQAEVRAAGGVLLLAEEHDAVTEMAAEIRNHRLAMRLLSDGRPEVSAYALDEPTQVMRRGRFDWLGGTILTDYKTAASSEPNAFVKAAVNFGYHQQADWYTRLASDLGHPAQAFAFVVQEKTAPFLVTVVELPPELVAIGRDRNQRALERFRDCTDSGVWPGYVSDDTFAQPAAPRWALYDQETAA